ncbi:Glyoxalase/Bleomycin resistance protein/Dihydroxybiphenyl dioxygenase [Aspergillus keveii]|uniref:Glyoxalase/Bleomycin resistance protein/Dihydroxybiphenyl dioxygenase n=1 Tax=Aspergillus keveii TaxID=714993 RepID=A0ABR4FZF4_9EURO
MAESTPTPNRGMTLADTLAMGPDQESQAAWLKKQNVNIDQRIKLTRLSHMLYQHPDLEMIHQFLVDFGLQVALRTDDEVWYEGYGPDLYVYYARKGTKKFLGGAFYSASWDDFQKTSKLPGAGEIEQLKDAPGGGFLVTVTDPEGYPMNVVWGQAEVQPESTFCPEKVVLNFPQAAQVLHLHFFNIVPTDFVYMEQDGHRISVTAFMHLDLGKEPVDHHPFFLCANPKGAHVHHSSYEVHDFDAQQLGHQWLIEKGYRPAWGIGRHVLGSQIFDYWWDISGNMVEHYADGDLVNAETPIGYMPAGEDSLAVWGPKVPGEFLGIRLLQLVTLYPSPQFLGAEAVFPVGTTTLSRIWYGTSPYLAATNHTVTVSADAS